MALFFILLCLVSSVISSQHPRRQTGRKGYPLGRSQPFFQPPEHNVQRRSAEIQPVQHVERANAPLVAQTEKTQKYVVDGKGIPDVNFDIGESYAGLMPISDKANETSQLYFWFFPTSNPDGKDDITIWLNGGPGCSSLEENGPFLWQYGTFKPVKNPYTWVNLTNMIWVEQPVGTGFSQGVSTETNQEAVAASFLGFWKNFVNTFDIKNKRVYITGESYAGMYVPYIADAMFNDGNKEYFDVQGTMIYEYVVSSAAWDLTDEGNSPSVNSDLVMQGIPAVAYVEAYDALFNLNDTTMADLRNRADKCGYTQFLKDALQFPPKGPLKNIPTSSGVVPDECRLWSDIFAAVTYTNPCFDIYSISTTCPVLWDVLGFPGSFDYVPEGATIYFNRTDVQKAINAPIQQWAECSNVALNQDTSLPSGLTILPSVIDRSQRTIIAHGQLDYVLLYNGTLMTIQNMTWGGQQGFQKAPADDLFIPYHNELSASTLAASGIMGITHTERKLTWVEVFLSGHMVPQYQPTVAYRQMEYLLGRIDSLSSQASFTTQKDVPQPPVGGWGQNGTAKSVKPSNATKLSVEQLHASLTGGSVGQQHVL